MAKGMDKYVDGIYFNAPDEGKPDFVISSIKIDLKQFRDFVKECRADEWVKPDRKGSDCLFFDLTQKQNPADGYSAKMWKKSPVDQPAVEVDDDDIPF
jgi:hypothetical protein